MRSPHSAYAEVARCPPYIIHNQPNYQLPITNYQLRMLLPTQWLYSILSLLIIIVMGFFFKFYTGFAHEWFNNNGAAVFYEIFWCVFVFLFWNSRKAVRQIPVWVFGVTCGLEFLQLWHPPILEQFRSTFIGRTLIGTTFSWWDFPHYLLGCVLGWLWLRKLAAIAWEVKSKK